MKKKVILALVIIFILLVIIIILMTKKEIYIVEIDKPDSVVKMVYQSPSGNVYEIVDKEAINKFVNSINHKQFKEKENYKDKLWSTSYVDLYDEKDECICRINLLSDKSILVDWTEYEAKDEYARDLLTDSGVLIKNIHSDEDN